MRTCGGRTSCLSAPKGRRRSWCSIPQHWPISSGGMYTNWRHVRCADHVFENEIREAPVQFICSAASEIHLLFEAVWRFFIECQAVRAGTELAKHAGGFLKTITEGANIQPAMMVEAAGEHLQLRRWLTAMLGMLHPLVGSLTHL